MENPTGGAMYAMVMVHMRASNSSISGTCWGAWRPSSARASASMRTRSCRFATGW